MLISRGFVLLVLVGVLTGCLSSQYIFTVKPIEATRSGEKIPLSAGLKLNKDYCDYTHTSVHQGGENIFKLGPTLCGYSKSLVRDIFSSVTVAENGEFSKAVNVIVIPNVSNVTVFYRTGVIPAKVESVVMLEWNITDRDGNIIYTTTVQGDGIDQRKYGLADVRYQTSMQNALDDLFEKSFRDIASSPELKKIADKAPK